MGGIVGVDFDGVIMILFWHFFPNQIEAKKQKHNTHLKMFFPVPLYFY